MSQWSGQQRDALNIAGRWLRERPKDKPILRIGGYAGTGKTTLAKHLASGVDGTVYFAAYTGKAAHQLQKSGAPNVSTIHKLIYQPKDKSQAKMRELVGQLEKLDTEMAMLQNMDPAPATMIAKCEASLKQVRDAIEAEKKNLSRPMFALKEDSPLQSAALLVVDEYSMIDRQMGEDLLTFGVPILALGDPEQLPPVGGVPFFDSDPDLMLTEIHRQANDNPIIRMSADVRAGRELKPGWYGDSRVEYIDKLARDEIAKLVMGADQLLVGKNDTRRSSNMRVRELLGRTSALPQLGDKLVCLRNNHEAGLLNGQLWTVVDGDSIFDDDYVNMVIEGEDETRLAVSAHADYFHGKEPSHWDIKNAECFDYGSALTVHKAQGSQWNHVVLFDEWYGNDRRKWLYTGLTRAAESIQVIRM